MIVFQYYTVTILFLEFEKKLGSVDSMIDQVFNTFLYNSV